MNVFRTPQVRTGTAALLAAAGLGCVGSGSAFGQSFNVRDDWSNNFRAGLQLAFNIRGEFSMGGLIPSNSGDPGPVGVPGANHFYDDGYVRVDDTGNAGGYTSYWGYQDASQYDPETGRLTYHNTRGFAVQNSSVEETAGTSIGFELAYGGRIHDWQRVRVGWEVGYGLMPIHIRDDRTLPATFARVVQSFDVGGITLPPAPYQGGASGLGPVIRDVAQGETPEITRGTLSGYRAIDVTLHSFRLGPTVFWRFHRGWALTGSLGPALGLVNGGYTYNETFDFENGTTSSNSGNDKGLEFAYGGYVSATILYRVIFNADLYLSAQFMTLSNVDYQSGGRQASLNLGATIMTSIGINWPF